MAQNCFMLSDWIALSKICNYFETTNIFLKWGKNAGILSAGIYYRWVQQCLSLLFLGVIVLQRNFCIFYTFFIRGPV